MAFRVTVRAISDSKEVLMGEPRLTFVGDEDEYPLMQKCFRCGARHVMRDIPFCEPCENRRFPQPRRFIWSPWAFILLLWGTLAVGGFLFGNLVARLVLRITE